MKESGMRRGVVSSVGAKGPMQVLGYWCEESLDQCDKVEAGVRALRLLRTCRKIDWDEFECKTLRKKPRPWKDVLCHYNSGNKCYDSSRQYAKEVLAKKRRLKRIHKKNGRSRL